MYGYDVNHSFETIGLSTKDERAPLLSLELSCFPLFGSLMFVR